MNTNVVNEALASGASLLRAGDRQNARVNFGQVIQSEPNTPAAWLGLAWSTNTPAEAVSILERAQQSVGDERLVHQLLEIARFVNSFAPASTEQAESDTDDRPGDEVPPDDSREVVATNPKPITTELSQVQEDQKQESQSDVQSTPEINDPQADDEEAEPANVEIDSEEIENAEEEPAECEAVVESTPSTTTLAETVEKTADGQNATPTESEVTQTAEQPTQPADNAGQEDLEAQQPHASTENNAPPATDRATTDDATPDDATLVEATGQTAQPDEAIGANVEIEASAEVVEVTPTKATPAKQAQPEPQPNVPQVDLQTCATVPAGVEAAQVAQSSQSTQPGPTASPTPQAPPAANVPTSAPPHANQAPATAGQPSPAEQVLSQATQLQQEVAASAQQPPQTPPKSTAQPVILAVDDSPTVRKLVSMTLESHGYKVESAANGLDALKMLATLTPDLILLDVNMPRMDGYKLCKMIKGHAKTQDIPVVMLSGKDGMFDKLRGKLAGCNDYISKPFESADLLQHVASQVGTPTA